MEQSCDWCGGKFTSAQDLLAHIRANHVKQAVKSAEKKEDSEFKCAQCGRKYKAKKTYLRHCREGHQPPVSCELCQKQFKTKRCLKVHQKLKHCGDNDDKIKSALSEKHIKVKTVPVAKRVKKTFPCGYCRKKFKSINEIKSHIQSKVCRKHVLQCRKCGMNFRSVVSLYKHKKEAHLRKYERTFVCNGCWRHFFMRKVYLQHVMACRELSEKRQKAHILTQKKVFGRKPLSDAPDPQWVSSTALDGNARIHTVEVSGCHDLQLSLIQMKDSISSKLKQDIADLKRIKWYMTAHIMVSKDKNEEEIFYLRSEPTITLSCSSLGEDVEKSILGAINSFDKAVDQGSLILFECFKKLELRVARYQPWKGASYYPLPKWLQRKKALINIKNKDDKCFLYACLAGISLPQVHPEKVHHYRNRRDELDMSGISFPVKVSSISKFEENNENVSVSVFGLEGRSVVPLRVSRNLGRNHHVRLLLLRGEEEEFDKEIERNIVETDAYEKEGLLHYVLIKNFSRLLSHHSKRKRQLYWCDNCLMPKSSMSTHVQHVSNCINFAAQKIRMPRKEESVMKFCDFEKQLHHDFVIYLDLESILVPFSQAMPNSEQSGSTVRQQHVPCGYCYCIVGPEGRLIKEPVLEHGVENLIGRLLKNLKEEEQFITTQRVEHTYPLSLSEDEEAAFQAAKNCYLCGVNFEDSKVVKCRDHDHRKLRNHYRGAACQICNLKLKKVDFIPVVVHGLSNYDAHLIISEIGRVSDGSDIKCIPKTKERYISFSWGKLRFLDSFQFLNASLDKLSKDLKKEDMHSLISVFPDENQRSLISRKGIYCYSYFDSEDKFKETQIPPREAFDSDLKSGHISDEDYELCQTIFKTFKMETLYDYHDLYLLVDVLLLTDVFEAYRKEMMACFRLDIVHYYTTPGFAWSAALLFTGQELQLIVDQEMHFLFENGLRGGVASINCRSADAHNPYVDENVVESPENTYIVYLDAVNLYGSSLCLPLPVGNFKFLTCKEIEAIDICSILVGDSTGFLFECDLEYPESLHDLHKDYPLAPTHMVPKYDLLSPLQKQLIEKFNLPKHCAAKKLIPTLYDKKNYVVYGTTLKLYLELGMKIQKIHKVISFDQKPWLKSFIEHNTKMRQKATSDFTKNLWKLLNNSCYGKTVENLRKRKNVEFTSKLEKFKKLVRSPLFHSFEIFDEGLVAVERRKGTILLNRPIYSGQVVLDTSKEIMYKFHYNCMKARYGDKITLLGTDTDSLMYKIITPDFYADMKLMLDWFDTSDYPPSHPVYSLKNKKVLGKFKDEMNSIPIVAYRGLRAKMYSFKTLNDKEKCVGKGIPGAAMKEQICFQDYDDCLKNKSVKQVTFSKIATDGRHHLYTTFCSKKGLSPYDDKRYLLSDTYETLPFGHYSLKIDREAEENLNELLTLLDESD